MDRTPLTAFSPLLENTIVLDVPYTHGTPMLDPRHHRGRLRHRLRRLPPSPLTQGAAQRGDTGCAEGSSRRSCRIQGRGGWPPRARQTTRADRSSPVIRNCRGFTTITTRPPTRSKRSAARSRRVPTRTRAAPQAPAGAAAAQCSRLRRHQLRAKRFWTLQPRPIRCTPPSSPQPALDDVIALETQGLAGQFFSAIPPPAAWT